MKLRILFIILLSLVLASCNTGPSEGDIQTAIAQTEQSRPAVVPATETSEPADTANTPEPTDTPESTNTLEPTNTAEPQPAGLTIGEQVLILAGVFTMGSNDGFDDEGPVHDVYLDDYYIDKYEVTNGQYEACVTAGICAPPSNLSSYTRTDYYGNPTYADYPVVNVDWYKSRAYCEWAGGRLPTEAEWEKAARGSDAREFPWGNDSPTSELANFDENAGDTTAVGSYPAGVSPSGVQDMAGNVWEWVNDWYQSDYYDDPAAVDNPSGPASGDWKVLRGGSWFDNGFGLRVAGRYYSYYPAYSSSGYGFRCARSP